MPVRCYLLRKGHIAAVELLEPGPDDSLIQQARDHFQRLGGDTFEGFEVWDRARRVYVWPPEEPPARPT